MIRTYIKPTQSNFNVALVLPDEYLGEELEVIVFKKNEGIENNKKTNSKRLSEKYKGVFTKEDAINFNNHTTQMREEWNNIL